MTELEVDSVIKSITFLKADGSGDYDVHRLTPEGKRKKQSKGLGAIERTLRKAIKKQATVSAAYLDRHENSNRRKRNGWAVDLFSNIKKARKAAKRQRVTCLRSAD